MNPLKSYEHELLTEVINPMREDEIKEKFSVFGNIEKIKHTSKYRIYDFIIREKKMLIEVTSTNMLFPYVHAKPKQRIRRALKHIAIKNEYRIKNACKEFRTIGVIFIDTVHAGIMNFLDDDYNAIMNEYDIDCVILICDNASVNGVSSRVKYPTKLFFNTSSKLSEDEKKDIMEKYN